MFLRQHTRQLLLLLMALPPNIMGGPVSSPEIAAKTGKSNNNNIQQQHQQQQQLHQQQYQNQNQHKQQEAHLNSLNVYATNYDMIANNQNTANANEEQFKPSYKLPDMETNFTPIQNGNSIAPDYGGHHLGAPAPVLMQYMPQTINEGGMQYLQLIPTRPLIVPIGPYLGGNNAGHSLGYGQTITSPHVLDYAPRPTAVLSPMPVNVPHPAPSPLVQVNTQPLPAYGIQSYAAHLQPYKQNYRINRETKDKILGPLSLNTNEYIPGPQQIQTQQAGFVRGRP